MTWGQLVLDAWELDRLLKHALVQMKKVYIFNDCREVMINVVVDVIQGEFCCLYWNDFDFNSILLRNEGRSQK